MNVIDGCNCDYCTANRPKNVTAEELVKLNERLDRYEKRVNGFIDGVREVFDSKSFWYLLGLMVGGL